MRLHRHPANRIRYDRRDLGQRAADVTTAFMGSWRFIFLQTIIIVAWVAANVTGAMMHWDPYPFILLNLAFSVQAAYASPLILLAQNRQTEHDRITAEEDYATNREALALLREIKQALDAERESA